jgi:murein L,D-transpeptidase YcbB/YkuD
VTVVTLACEEDGGGESRIRGRLLMLQFTLASLIALSFSMPVAATDTVTIRSAIADLSRGRTVLIDGEPICAARPLPLFYTRRQFVPAWSDRDRNDLQAAIGDAGADGLDPSEYHLASIARTSEAEARDLLLTDAFFLLTSHLLSGRVDPESVEPTWCLTPRANDLVAALETALELHDVRATIARMPPTHRDYGLLRDALADLRRRAAAGGWPPLSARKSIRPGDRGEGVIQLAARLAASGELPRTSEVFDGPMDAAVRRFQRLHGLAVDGVVGARTRAALNVTATERVRQIELNLERWRWLPSTLGDPHVLINIPAFSLVVTEHDRPVLSMRIVVGKDYLRTPIFSGAITQVILSPFWNVPESIAAKELRPKERRTPGYLAHEHIEVLKGGRLRQMPGPWNSLGLIKFNIPNRYGVYLHDTPAKGLFEESTRAFSHGCMRIERPVELATWLLRDRPEWTRDRIVDQSQRGIEKAIDVRKPLPVHVLYWTVYIDDGDGEVHFAPDIYQRDARLEAAMHQPPANF